MTYTLACRDLGAHCDFVAKGASPVEVKRAVWGHLQRDHQPVAASLTPGMRAELDRQMDGLLGGHRYGPGQRPVSHPMDKEPGGER
jgi:predicted small metal-binding protein